MQPKSVQNVGGILYVKPNLMPYSLFSVYLYACKQVNSSALINLVPKPGPFVLQLRNYDAPKETHTVTGLRTSIEPSLS